MSEQLLRRPEVEARTGLSRSSIYRMMDEGQFPRPIRIAHRAVAWRASDLDRWQAQRPEAIPDE